jgi:hypothetical protein
LVDESNSPAIIVPCKNITSLLIVKYTLVYPQY